MLNKRSKYLRFLAGSLVAGCVLIPLVRADDNGGGPPPRGPQAATQPADGPQGGPGGGGPPGGGQAGGGRPQAGFHLIQRFALEKMDLTDEQKQQIAALEKETKAKLAKILTADQMKTLNEARPPRPGGQGGAGGGQGGPGGGGGPDGGGGPGGGGADQGGPPGK